MDPSEKRGVDCGKCGGGKVFGEEEDGVVIDSFERFADARLVRLAVASSPLAPRLPEKHPSTRSRSLRFHSPRVGMDCHERGPLARVEWR